MLEVLDVLCGSGMLQETGELCKQCRVTTITVRFQPIAGHRTQPAYNTTAAKGVKNFLA